MLLCFTSNAQVSFQYEGAVPCLGASDFVNGGIEIVNPPAGAFTFEWIVTSPEGTVTNNSNNNPLGISFDEPGCWEVELYINGNLELTDNCGVEIFPDPVIQVDLTDVIGCTPFSPVIGNNTFSPSGADLTYQWNLGICGSTDAENIEADFCTLNFEGAYPLSLLVEDSNGCFSQFDLDSAVLVSDQPPVASFGQSSTIDCNLPVEVIFGSSGTVVSDPATYSWTVDGAVQAETSDTLIVDFDTAGTYEVCLEVTDSFGCSDIFCSTVEFFEAPVADFIFDPAVICAGMEVEFENTSNPLPIPTTEWDLDGDGTVDSTGDAPVFSYPNPGVYDAQLTIAWSENCADSITQEVTVDPPIEALFELDTLWGCSLPFTIEVTDLSVATGIPTYNWFYIDENGINVPIDLTADTYTFTDWGQYQIGLTLSNDIGCFDQFIFPEPVNLVEPQMAYLLTAASTCVGDVISTNIFINQSLDPFINWFYDIDCDGTVDQEVLGNTNGNTTFTFDTAGTYDICLVAESANGCSETSTASITIAPQIFSSFTVSDQTPCGIDFPLFETTNPDPALTYEWFFGDGNSSGLGPFTEYAYSYCDTGFFDVTLSVSNLGCFTSSIIEDFVYVAPPIADFSIQTNCEDYYTVTFENLSILPEVPLTTWTIDGVEMYVGEFEPVHTFTTEGIHEVTLYVENPVYGCTDTKTRTVKINEPTFEVDIGPTTGCPPVNVNIVPLDLECVNFWQVQLEGTDFLQAQIGALGWDLDWDVNGNTGSPNNQPTIDWPSVTYTNIGLYSIGMTLIDGNGCQIDTIFEEIIDVNIDPFFAQIDSTVTRYCDSTLVCVSPVLDGLSNHQWSTSTGLMSSAEDTCFVFYPPYNQDPGIEITLYAEDGIGCGSTVTDVLLLAPEVQACFSVSNYNPCKDEEVLLSADCSVCGVEPCTYNWDIDQDGNFDNATGTETNFSSNENGTFVFQLEMTDAEGCISYHTDSLAIHTPEITYEITEAIFACQSTFTFTNVTEGDGISSFWFVDGFDDDGPIPEIEFNNPANQPQQASFTSSTIGVYNFFLEATNEYGCVSDSTVSDFLDYSEDIGDFTCVLDDINCVPFDAECQAFNPNDSDFQYSWNMGDNTPFSTTTVDHVYTEPGIYTISLTMTDTDNLCQFSISNEPFEVTLLEYALDGLNTVCPEDSALYTNFVLDSLVWLSPLNQIFEVSDNEWYLTPEGETEFVSTGYLDGCFATQSLLLNNFTPPTFITQQHGPFCQNEGAIPLPIIEPLGGVYTLNNQVVNELNTFDLNEFGSELGYSVIGDNNCENQFDLTVELLDTTAISLGLESLCFFTDVVDLENYASDLPAQFQVSYDGVNFEDSQEFAPLTIPDYPNSVVAYPYHYYHTNANNCLSELTGEINVHPSPSPQFFVSEACENEPVDFISASTIGSGTIESYQWLVDGENLSTEENLEDITFDQFGTYQVQLTVESDQQCVAALSLGLIIHPSPSLNFQLTDVCLGEEIMVTPIVFVPSGVISEVTTDWGDDTIILDENTHVYQNWGSYDVMITAVSDEGCVSSQIEQISVNPLPVAGFVTIDHCFGQETQIQDNSSIEFGSIAEVNWTVPAENVMSDGVTFDYTFSQAGMFTIESEVISSEGCSSESTGMIEVYPRPIADFSISNKPTCLFSEIIVFDESTVESSNIEDIFWQINGLSYEGAPIQLVFDDLLTADVQLTVVTTEGCADVVVQEDAIEVLPKPEAGFSLDPNPATLVDNLVQITDFSENAVLWEYQLSDGSVDNISEPSYTFTDVGTYEVLQIVTNSFGCLDSMLVEFDVFNSLVVHVPNAITADNDGLNETFAPVIFGDEVQEYEFVIWNRWGIEVFRSIDPLEPWAGNVDGGEYYTQNEVYNWRLAIKGVHGTKEFFEGYVTVVR